jgi:hypothetical protein
MALAMATSNDHDTFLHKPGMECSATHLKGTLWWYVQGCMVCPDLLEGCSSDQGSAALDAAPQRFPCIRACGNPTAAAAAGVSMI